MINSYNEAVAHLRNTTALYHFKSDVKALLMVDRSRDFSLSDGWQSIRRRFLSTDDYEAYRYRIEAHIYHDNCTEDIPGGYFSWGKKRYHPVEAFELIRKRQWFSHISDITLSEFLRSAGPNYDWPRIVVDDEMTSIGCRYGYFCFGCRSVYGVGEVRTEYAISNNHGLCDDCLIKARSRKALATQRAAALVRQYQAGKALEAQQKRDEMERTNAALASDRAAKKARRDQNRIRREAAALAWEMQGSKAQPQENNNASG